MGQDSTDQKYERDRFDDIEPYTTQQGAHRKDFAAPKGAGHLNAIIIAGGAALAIGIGSYLWLLPSDPLNQAASESEETVSESVEEQPQEPEESIEPEAVEEPEPTDEPETIDLGQPDNTENAESPEETDEPESEESVDYELPIGVYNASTIQGYAASVAQELGGAGFNVPIADNWTGAVPASTTVYFSENEATAVAVAEQLGAVAIYEPSVDGVLVVLTGN